jgi:biopolymer transport protein ExbD
MVLLPARDADGMMADINVTPFTDVLLVLLIVFMTLAALIAQPGFQRRLPCKCPHHAAAAVPPLEVTVSARGDMWVGLRRTDARRIYSDLRAALAASRTRAIALDASAGAPYGTILRVLDAAKAAGDVNVTLVTQ